MAEIRSFSRRVTFPEKYHEGLRSIYIARTYGMGRRVTYFCVRCSWRRYAWGLSGGRKYCAILILIVVGLRKRYLLLALLSLIGRPKIRIQFMYQPTFKMVCCVSPVETLGLSGQGGGGGGGLSRFSYLSRYSVDFWPHVPESWSIVSTRGSSIVTVHRPVLFCEG